MNNGPTYTGPPRATPQQHGAVTAATVRDRLFFALFERAALFYARVVPMGLRRLIEFFTLLLGILLLALLVFVHVAFIRTPSTCLSNYTWNRQGILRVEMAPDQADLDYFQRTCNSAPETYYGEDEGVPLDPSDAVDGVCPNPSFYDLIRNLHAARQRPGDANAVGAAEPQAPEPSFFETFLDLMLGPVEQSGYPTDMSIIEYAEEFGFLRLSYPTRHRYGIPVTMVKLDLEANECFGGNLSRFLLQHFLGYDEVVMSSIKLMAERFNRTNGNLGYVRNVLTGEHFKYVSMGMTRTTYLASALIMILFTFSISMLLRFAHHQLFFFIVELLQLMENNIPVSVPTAPLLTAVLALVGMEAIMSEFFNDAGTAFYVILTVWLADQYDAVCCHTPVSKRYWLRFFYMYHLAFYAYHYRFNGQYSGLALAASAVFIFHSMIYFFHHYELPSLLRQRNIRSSIAEMIHTQAEQMGQPQNGGEQNNTTMVEEIAIPDGRGGRAGTARVTIRAVHHQHPIPVNQRREAGERIAALVVNDVIESVLRRQQGGGGRGGGADPTPPLRDGAGPGGDAPPASRLDPGASRSPPYPGAGASRADASSSSCPVHHPHSDAHSSYSSPGEDAGTSHAVPRSSGCESGAVSRTDATSSCSPPDASSTSPSEPRVGWASRDEGIGPSRPDASASGGGASASSSWCAAGHTTSPPSCTSSAACAAAAAAGSRAAAAAAGSCNIFETLASPPSEPINVEGEAVVDVADFKNTSTAGPNAAARDAKDSSVVESTTQPHGEAT